MSRSNGKVQTERSYHTKFHVKYQSFVAYYSHIINKVKVFSKSPDSKVKATRSKLFVPMEVLVTRNTHVKYQSSSAHCSKVISKVKVSDSTD